MSTRDLITRLRTLGVRLSVADSELKVSAPKGVVTPELADELKAAKTELMELLSAGEAGTKSAAEPIAVADRSRPIPLSFAQKRIWFLEEFEGGTSVYNIPWAMRIRGSLNASALEGAVNDLVARHESLRTTFVAENGEPHQVILDQMNLCVDHVDLRGCDDATLQRKLGGWSTEGFNLKTGPLLKVRLVELGDTDHALMMVIHHIVSDAWSLNVLQREFMNYYLARCNNSAARLEPLPIQFADYAVWQQDHIKENERGRQLDYWRRQLAGAPPLLELPTDRPRPSEQSYSGGRMRRTMRTELLRRLEQLARDHDATLFMAMLAAFNVLLYRYSGEDDLVIGTPIAGRQRSELESLIGLFLNTLAIRTDISGDPTFIELLNKVQMAAMDAYANQDLPFEKLVDELAPERNLSYPPVFQVLFVLQNVPETGQPITGLEISNIEFDYGTAKFDLTLAAGETSDGLVAEIEYSADLFDAITIEHMLEHYEIILEALAKNPDQRISALSLITPTERAQLADWNNTAVSYPQNATLQSLLETQAAATPDAEAIVFEDASISYRELNERANQLAHWLIAHGTRPDDLIGVCMNRSVEMVIALLGTIKAGLAYVPLDPEYPEHRLEHMFEDANIKVLLAQSGVQDVLPVHSVPVLLLDQVKLDGQPGGNPPARAFSNNLAYAIFTSGSTGRPKGVMNEHRGIVNRLLWMQDEYRLDHTDRILQKTPFSFDVSVWEFFWPLISGATLVMAKPGGHKDPNYLVDIIRRQRVTTMHFVPSMLQVFLQDGTAAECHTLRRVICSGEALSHDLQTRFYSLLGRAGLHNLYGPTEAAIDVTYWACPRESTVGIVPIGRPVANTHIYIVDAAGDQTPIGVPGELWIGGIQVARGYANRPDLTAERFIPDPFVDDPTAHVYRTGDLTRFRRDGTVEFLGRIDDQVKLRGFRIELGEIEANLDALTDVEQSLVVLREDIPGSKRLVAYLKGAQGAQPDIPEVRKHLHEELPDYMVPAAFVVLPEFPLMPNGKVNRSALPEPSGERDVDTEFVPPRTSVEQTLADIWSDLLRADRVGIHDNFFDLGGDSILSIQIITRAANEGLQLAPKQVFQHQTIAGLAEAAGTLKRVVAEQGLVTGTAGLTPVQHWFLNQQSTYLDHFNQSTLLEFAGTLDEEILNRAFLKLFEHHDALRLHFEKTAQGWQQTVAGLTDSGLMRCFDLSNAQSGQQDEAMLAAAQELQASLDITAGIMLSAGIFHLGDQRNDRLLIVIHHLAVDGISWRILLEDLENLYAGLIANKSVKLPAKTSSVLDWANHLQDLAGDDSARAAAETWSEPNWPDFQALPVDQAGGSNRVESTRRIGMSLDADTTRQLLQQVPSAYHTQINDILLAALAMAFRQWTGDPALLVDMEGHGREEKIDDVDISRTVGWFTTIYPIALNIGVTTDTGDLIKSVKEQLRQVPDNGFDFGLLRYLGSDSLRNLLQTVPQPEILFNYLGQFDQSFNDDQLFKPVSGATGSDQSPARTRSHLIDINGSVFDGKLQLGFSYSNNIYNRQTIETLAQGFEYELRKIIDHCVQPESRGYTPSDFPLAGIKQQQLDEILSACSDLEDLFPMTPMQHGMLFHNIFSEQAAEHASQTYLSQVLWEFAGDIDRDAFAAAWQVVTDRHASLRTSFYQSGLQHPLAIVHKSADAHLIAEDWRDKSPAQQQDDLQALLAAESGRGFDLAHAPLMRLYLLRFAENNYRFIWSHHHIIMDGWSIPVVLEELFAAYAAATKGVQAELQPAKSYRDYIEWLLQQDRDAAQEFWVDKLAGFDAPTPLPLANKAWRGAQGKPGYAKHYATMSAEDTVALRDSAKQLRLTLNTLAQGLWALLLARYTGEGDILFGATTSGRPAELKNVEGMVGLFLNTLPVRVSIDTHSSAKNWLADVQEQQLIARQHEYASLVDIQGWSPVPRGTPLFHSLLIFENYPDVSSLWTDREAIEVRDMQALGWTSFPLTAAVSVGEQLILRLNYDTDYFDSATADLLAKQFVATLRTVAACPDLLVHDLLLPDTSVAPVTAPPTPQNDFGNFPAEILETSLVKRFEQQAAATPDADAVVTESTRWSYYELNCLANEVAHELIHAGVQVGGRTGLLLAQDAPMLAGLIGTLKTGTAYVPLDPKAPATRLNKIVDDAELGAIVCAPQFADLAQALAADSSVDIIVISPEAADLPNPDVEITPDSMAYILFTSGSTGLPKGVMQTHRNVLHHVRAYINALHIDRGDKLTLFSPYGFDAAVMDIYGALLTGACLYPFDVRQEESARTILEKIQRGGISIFHATPTVYRFLFDQATHEYLDAVRLVVLGGEEARPSDLELFRARCNRDALFVNGLGPTESTLALQFFADHETQLPGSAIPAGRAVAGTEVLLLDAHGEPAALHGEICISSPYVTPGYWRDEELTAAAFSHTAPGATRVYRTGDLGRYAPDGQIIFVGRRDAQVKVRGHRIEPGEIEAILGEHPAIEVCAVILRDDSPGDPRLAAYFVTHPGSTADSETLREFVHTRLPDYMVPAAFVELDKIPLTPNGKLDRNSLPAPAWAADEDNFVAPATADERAMAAIWCELLSIEKVGIHDDFFALGGHSLIATQLMARIRDAVHYELPLRTLFERPTIAGLCAAMGSATDTAPDKAIQPRASNDELPLSFAQQRLWFLDQLNPGGTVYTLSWATRLIGKLDTTALQAAINELAARHEPLRTHFAASTGKDAIQIIEQDCSIPLQTEDLPDANDKSVQQRLEQLIAVPFDLSAGPLFRVHLLQVSDTVSVMLIMIHHIISDAWSRELMYRDLLSLYRKHRGLPFSELPELKVQYADYALWQRQLLESDEAQRQLEYWLARLDSAPPLLEIPTDRPRPTLQTFAGNALARQIPQALTEKLQQLARSSGTTDFMVTQAAFALLMGRYAQQDDVVLGTPVAGRNHTELENLIGFFLNTLALRTDLSGDPTFKELLAEVKQNTIDAYAHQNLPFEKLVEELQPERDTSHSPVFQVMFTVVNPTSASGDFPDLKLEAVEREFRNAKFDLFVSLSSWPDGFYTHVEYNTDLFDSATIERMLDHFETLLAGIVADPDARVSQLPLMDATERQHVLTDFNDTAMAVSDRSVSELFEQQAAATPAAVALTLNDAELSYQELNARANRLARELVAQGAGPGALVGIACERSIEMAVGVLAVLKSGSAYVPIDPNYPAERVGYMLEDSRAPVLLTQSSLVDQLPGTTAAIVCVDEFDFSAGDAGNLDAGGASVYAIYTSGSTGKPKGVELTHAGLANLIQWQNAQPGLSEPARTLQFASLSFDVSFQELFTTWAQGGTVVLVDEELRRDLPRLAKFIAEDNIERVYLPYAALQPLADSVATSGLDYTVRDVIVAGEQLQVTPPVKEMFRALGEARLHNQYGPSETHVTTAFTLSGDPDAWMALPPIGTPVANTQVYVLDQNNEPVPVGIPGELYLAGVQVAKGYIHRPELTAEKFLPDPFRPGQRMYKTGDRVRFLADGNLEYLGRTDDQVKWRGFRIEPGEIEARLAEHPTVQQAAVLLREDSPGDKRLVAYLVAAPEQAVDTNAVKNWLKDQLPDYMVPSALLVLESMPLTPSGKVARRKLPVPDYADSAQAYVAPRTPVEEALVQIWADVLRVPQVGIHDDFFELGGHSLLAMRLVSRIRDELQIELPLLSLFSHPTAAGLAPEIEGSTAGAASAITQVDRSQPLPMSFAQQRLWFLEIMGPGTATYNVPWAARVEGALDLEAMQKAVDDLVARHESLRTTFADGDDGPVQIIAPRTDLEIELHDLGTASEKEVSETVSRISYEPFDLQQGPLLRVTVLQQEAHRNILMLCMHHIICDAWSQDLLYRELLDLYHGHLTGTPVDLAPLPIQYADYAAWHRNLLSGRELDRQMNYWRKQLSDAPPLLSLPLDNPRPAKESHEGEHQSLQLDKKLSDQLSGLATQNKTTLFVLLLATFNLFLHRYSDEADLVIGTPISGRHRSETEGIIGFFLNTLAIRTDTGGNPGFTELLDRTRRSTLAAFAHQDLPFEKLVEELQPVRNVTHAPIFQALFVFNKLSEGMPEHSDLRLSGLEYDFKVAKFDIQLSFNETTNGLLAGLRYKTALFDNDTIQRMLEHYHMLLKGIVANPDQGIDDLPMLTEDEHQLITKSFNATETEFTARSTVELVQAQVAATPNETALSSSALTLTYRELNARANRLANTLVNLGITQGSLVAICAQRGPNVPVAILAVLKAGAAYVPVDPAYPADRIAYMLEDSRATTVLTEAPLMASLPAEKLSTLCLDSYHWESGNDGDPGLNIAAADPVYGIYTSGSTGLPKGVLLSHGGLANLLQWQKAQTTMTEPARTLQFASFSFDVSFQEIFSTWQQGGTLCMIDEEMRRDLAALAQHIAAEKIERLYLPFAALQPLVDCFQNERLQSKLMLKDIVVAGEQLQITPAIRELFTDLGHARLHNQYGPSETHVVTAHTLASSANDWPTLPPIGMPVANTRAYVVDDQIRLMPVGVPGELVIGGVQVGIGYLHRARLTAEKFISDPFSDQPGSRLYRTGDRVRYLADGNLEYLGRTDDQIKWRGFRIEPGEIESVLAELDSVKQVAVVLREDTPGDKRLVAYFVGKQATDLDASALRNHAKNELPDYMVPSAFVALDSMPLTPSGKVARRKLPEPALDAGRAKAGDMPESNAEIALAKIWQKLLKVGDIGLDDNFFDLGGHSLMTIKLIQELEKVTGERLTIADIFENPTVREFAPLLGMANWPEQATQPKGWSRKVTGKIAGWFSRS